MQIEGKIIKYKDNVNTDEIIPGRYLNTTDPKELARHCMEGIDKDFLSKVKEAKIIVAGENFGCGSSREHAPLALKAAGVGCIIAVSFARIFFRNAINIGLPILEARKVFQETKEKDILKVDTVKGKIINLTRDKVYFATPYPKFLQDLIEKGGIEKWVKERIKSG